jgi:hypothetical protein
MFSVMPKNNISKARSRHLATQPLWDEVYTFYTLFGACPRAGSRGENLTSSSVAHILTPAFIAELPSSPQRGKGMALPSIQLFSYANAAFFHVLLALKVELTQLRIDIYQEMS